VEQTSTLSLGGSLPGLGGPGAGAKADGTEITDDIRTAVAALPAGSALLIVTHGPNAGSRFLLDQAVTTAGRHPESDIFLDDVTVSRRHAELKGDETGRFRVADVGSLNGTYLNRQRIDEGPLSSGDEVQIGKFRLLFLVAEQGPPGAIDLGAAEARRSEAADPELGGRP
jgi:pSer/pThr/pTyr-binding forkhead associated (FHA) protein